MNVVKRSSSLNNACTACRRRKVKCIGNPCAFCLQKNYVCEFKQQNKRGPRVLKLPSTEIDEFQLELNHVQQYMGEVCQQNCFIDFYFQYLGKAVPLDYKQSLITPTKNNFEYKPQIYIITASIMKLYGNEDAETLYITKARRASNLFDCDTLESSITLLMMALYLGGGTKAHNLILMAQNALRLPSVENSPLVGYMRGACQALSITYDPSISQQTKSAYVLGLFSYDISTFASNHTSKDLIEICLLRAKHTLSNLIKFEDTSVSTFLQSVALTTVQNEYNRSSVLEEINKISEVLKGIKYSESDSVKINNAHFVVLYSKFIVEWRCGYKQAAYNAALSAFQFCKENLPALAIRFSNMVHMLSIPYFMRGCGAFDVETECLRYLESAYGSIGKAEQLKLTWAEMSGNLDSYKISQLETELLGNTEFLLFPNNALLTNL